jgi:hypothetical protein
MEIRSPYTPWEVLLEGKLSIELPDNIGTE